MIVANRLENSCLFVRSVMLFTLLDIAIVIGGCYRQFFLLVVNFSFAVFRNNTSVLIFEACIKAHSSPNTGGPLQRMITLWRMIVLVSGRRGRGRYKAAEGLRLLHVLRS